MSTLWTPSGERPINRTPSASPPSPDSRPAAGRQPGSATPPGASPPAGDTLGGGAFGGLDDAGSYADGDLPDGMTPEMAEEMAAMAEQMLRTPAAVIIANQCLAFYELAALHLGQERPALAEAQLAIDAFAAVVEGMGPRLGQNARPLTEALNQLRMAFVQAKLG
ncbi:MAG: hypothetical protein ACT4OS_06750 [Acidimicrobiales bacterium]